MRERMALETFISSNRNNQEEVLIEHDSLKQLNEFSKHLTLQNIVNIEGLSDTTGLVLYKKRSRTQSFEMNRKKLYNF